MQCLELRTVAPSLSLVAAVAAIETLVRSDEGKPPTCSTCGIPQAREYCIECQVPIYGLRSNFKEFLTSYGGATLGKFANQLYDFRSGISHSGRLLRREMGDMGFNKGGKDEETLFGIDVPRVTRAAMVNWLKARHCEESSD